MVMSISALNYMYSFRGDTLLTDRRLFALSANGGHNGIMCCLLLLSLKAKEMHFQMEIHHVCVQC